MTELTSNDRLTIDDCTRAGYCASGVRRWCHSRGIDLKTFLSDGLPIDEARALNDGLVDRALALKENSDGR